MVRCSFLGVIMIVFFSAGVTGQYNICTGQLDTIGDGRCDSGNNSPECHYDGGDCCECSCINDRRYPCGIWGFNCSDPDVLGGAGGCQRNTASVNPCTTDFSQMWLVNDTTSANSLAEAVNCSGGTFYVTWRGSVLVNQTIHIPDGTTLNVTGEGSGAEVNGGGKTRLFMAVGAELFIDGLILSNGNAMYGGAIAATRSRVGLSQTLCSDNIASSFGGAIYVGVSSTLAWEGHTVLTRNHAGRGGGAVAVSMSSNASWSGPTHFSFNSAIGNESLGGAIFVHDSEVSWNGETSFTNNTSSYDGGALYVWGNSIASCDGETSFTNNTSSYDGGAMCVGENSIASWYGATSFIYNTGGYGGALLVYSDSIASWDGETSFTNNTSSYYGGAMYVWGNSNASWYGATSFVDNTGGYGGALLVSSDSIASWDGETSFTNNTSSYYGGALYVWGNSNASWYGATSFADNTGGYGGALLVSSDSIASWDGETFFTNNTSSDYGGAMYVWGNSNASWYGATSFVDNTGGYGGALLVYSDSIASWDGETFFTNNTSSDYGGAMYVWGNSIASWYGATSFADNTGGYGGALLVSSDSIASWDGETFFTNNTSSDDGGAMYVWGNSNASWYGATSFVDNIGGYGGALLVSSDSIASWDGETFFTNNTSSDDGGAMYVWGNSIASWYGATSFVDNIGGYGGALLVSSDSIASWNGKTSFANNAAGHGGALYVYSDSLTSWDGETSFTNNTSRFDGGAMYVHETSTASWDGATSFVNNTADDGGALFAFINSNVSWDGKTSFANNMADEGGALYVWSNCIISWDGEMSFTANNARSSGGAVFAGSSSNIIVGGDTDFTENEAATDGGAAYITSSRLIVDNNSTVIFQSNICGGSGGAIALVGDVFTRFPPSVTFWGNTAGAAGGAIYLSSVDVGMRFEGTRFISNSAAIGGGLFSTSSGNLGHDPTTLIGCEFVGNEAKSTGGAIRSDAGRDKIVNTSFERNTASLGGALRLVGRTSIVGCKFVENLSDEEEGPGISNDGIISEISRCTFVNNVFNCLAGFFLGNNETSALFDTVCKGCNAQCSGCTVEGKEPLCIEELKHSSSSGGNTTLESLLIDPGYWRAANTSLDILACYNTEACLGGLTVEEGFCHEGYEGPYCSVCMKGYTKSLGFACTKCSDNAAGGIALAVVMAAVFVLVFIAFLSYMLSGKMGDADKGIVARVTRFIPLQSVKIIIVVWQILTQFSAVANVVFPSVYQRFLDVVDILNFDLSWVLSADCIIDTDFHDQLLLATLGPLVCMVILGGTYNTAMRRNRASEEARGIVRRKHLSMVLLLTFLIYSSVSSTLFKTFACDKLDDGKNYLRADYRLECDSSKHTTLEIYAFFMVILYVVGIPAFYGVLLYNSREALMNAGREGDESIKPITDLWKPYRPDRFYYEVIECGRRVLLTGALVFIYPNTAAQIAVALMLETFFIIVNEALAPNVSAWDTWCSRTGHVIVYTSIFLALLLKVDVSGERASSQRVFESVLIGAHSCLILIVVVEAAAMVMVWRQEIKDVMEPRIRPNLSVLSPGVGRGGLVFESDDEVLPPLSEGTFKGSPILASM